MNVTESKDNPKKTKTNLGQETGCSFFTFITIPRSGRCHNRNRAGAKMETHMWVGGAFVHFSIFTWNLDSSGRHGLEVNVAPKIPSG